MSRVRLILQGFVDLNLETNENINTKILCGDTSFVDKKSLFKKVYNSPENKASKELQSILNNLNIDIDSVFGAREINQEKHSRINSDKRTFVIILNEVLESSKKEVFINSVSCLVYIYSKKDFDVLVREHDQLSINFFYNSEARNRYGKVKNYPDLNPNKLISKVKLDSDVFWNKGKSSIKNKKDDFIYFFWKSIEILCFAEQILEKGEIYDADAYSYLLYNMIESLQDEFYYFNENISPVRELIKLKLNMFIDDEDDDFMNFKL